MSTGSLTQIKNTDIYLIDQILKGRYDAGGKLLDAGCGSGRNISWFVAQPLFEVYATDIEPAVIDYLLQVYPTLPNDRVSCHSVQALPFADEYFDHVLCSTVLHFAESKADFLLMFSQLVRVLKTAGSIFIRMASDIGLEHSIVPLGDGRFALPDGSDRFLLTKSFITELLTLFPLSLAEPVKTTNVQDLRCMTTLVLIKTG